METVQTANQRRSGTRGANEGTSQGTVELRRHDERSSLRYLEPHLRDTRRRFHVARPSDAKDPIGAIIVVATAKVATTAIAKGIATATASSSLQHSPRDELSQLSLCCTLAIGATTEDAEGARSPSHATRDA